MKYHKRPVEVEATQWFKNGDHAAVLPPEHGVVSYIKTHEGDMLVRPGDWIITGVNGESYPYKPDIFAATYEEVQDATT